MPPAAMHFASGNSFFSGLVLIAAAHLVFPGDRTLHQKLRGGVSLVLLIVGELFVVLSSTPQPWWLGAALVVAILPLSVSLGRATTRVVAGHVRRKRCTFAVFMGVASVSAFHEWNSTRFQPPPAFASGVPIYVIGDSISAAGTDAAVTAWPDLLRQAGRPVTNLARIGATARSAMQQAERIPAGPAVVHILIGGNDFFGSTTAAQFEIDLAALLIRVAAPDRAIVIWELPLPPFHHAYGAAQRRQVAAVDGAIVSKRALAHVLATPRATVDGIHLSPLGQQVMANIAVDFLPAEQSR